MGPVIRNNGEKNGEVGGSIVDGGMMTPGEGRGGECAPMESTQSNIEVPQSHNPPVMDINEALKNMNELLSCKTIIKHHLAFTEECIGKSMYPLGLKTFVPCVA